MNRDAHLSPDDPVVVRIMAEVEQAPSVRQPLIAALEKKFDGRCVLVYFTSFQQPVMIQDTDADIIESLLLKSNLKNGLLLIIHSPGGDGLAAERIINVCRAYSRGNFEVIVPKMAKSAATMICFGAQRIWMSQTSELGPVDVQVVRANRLIPAHTIIKSYDELVQTVERTKGPIDPYLDQLSHYDVSEINDLRMAQQVAENIAITALQTGMMKGTPVDDIRRKIRPFITPSLTLSHGRRIGLDVVQQCGLAASEIPLDGDVWPLVWDLYIRSSWYVANRCSRFIQTRDHCVETPQVLVNEEDDLNGLS